MRNRYVGGGPYCYANSLSMLLGAKSPGVADIEVLTGSPFGLCFEDGLAFFSPHGWNPEIGIADVLELLGWTCTTQAADSASDAVERLRTASRNGPVLAGPVELGLLLQQPESGAAIGADHYVVVVGVDADGTVSFHDPHGYPFATLPAEAFAAAWRTDAIGYPCTSFTMRTSFRQVRQVEVRTALRAALPAAVRWLTRGDPAATARQLAGMIESGLDGDHYAHLAHFSIRVGARRLIDAATLLAGLGLDVAAGILEGQARLVGALQYPLVAGDTGGAARLLRELAPTYRALHDELSRAVVS